MAGEQQPAGVETPGQGTPAPGAGAQPGGTPSPGPADAGGQGGENTVEHWKAKATHWEREAKGAFQARDQAKTRFLDSDEGKSLIKDRDELAGLKDAAAKEKGQWKELAEAKETENKALKAQIEEGGRRAKATAIRTALDSAYVAAGGLDSETFTALTASPAAITVGDDGKVAGVEEIVKKLKETKPHLFKPAGAGGGGGPGPIVSGQVSDDPLKPKPGATLKDLNAHWNVLRKRT
ncbi:MAG: hypothetical protein ACRDHY_02335 [Anaerolineales bacterium]